MRHMVSAIALLGSVMTWPAMAQDVEVFGAFDQTPGNVTVSGDGRVFVSMHQLFQPSLAVAEVVDGELVPFPNAAWSDHGVAGDPGGKLNAVLGIQATADGRVWMLDNGVGTGNSPKLVAWDLASDSLAQVIDMPAGAVSEASFLNDLAVDMSHGAIFIADTAFGPNPALVVVDIATGAARRVLEADTSTAMENIETAVDGKALAFMQPDGSSFNPRFGVNSIALDANDEWLYFGPFSGTSMYRVRTADLIDGSLDNGALAARVERFADKPLSDGISVDTAGNVYISDVTTSAIGVIDGTTREYRVLLQDDGLIAWPDSFSFDGNGRVLATVTQLHRAPFMNGGENALTPPFNILQFDGLAAGVPGR